MAVISAAEVILDGASSPLFDHCLGLSEFPDESGAIERAKEWAKSLNGLSAGALLRVTIDGRTRVFPLSEV